MKTRTKLKKMADAAFSGMVNDASIVWLTGTRESVNSNKLQNHVYHRVGARPSKGMATTANAMSSLQWCIAWRAFNRMHDRLKKASGKGILLTHDYACSAANQCVDSVKVDFGLHTLEGSVRHRGVNDDHASCFSFAYLGYHLPPVGTRAIIPVGDSHQFGAFILCEVVPGYLVDTQSDKPAAPRCLVTLTDKPVVGSFTPVYISCGGSGKRAWQRIRTLPCQFGHGWMSEEAAQKLAIAQFVKKGAYPLASLAQSVQTFPWTHCGDYQSTVTMAEVSKCVGKYEQYGVCLGRYHRDSEVCQNCAFMSECQSLVGELPEVASDSTVSPAKAKEGESVVLRECWRAEAIVPHQCGHKIRFFNSRELAQEVSAATSKPTKVQVVDDGSETRLVGRVITVESEDTIKHSMEHRMEELKPKFKALIQANQLVRDLGMEPHSPTEMPELVSLAAEFGIDPEEAVEKMHELCTPKNKRKVKAPAAVRKH